jgi:hypothetical protein
MPEREHPTIPQIVQALVTLHDRHQADMKKIRADHVERIRRLRQGTEPMPPMDHKWDRYDIEYAEFITDEDGDGYFINKYKKAENRDDALAIARELLANNNVAGIHLLFRKANTTSAWQDHGHAQTDLVAKSQNEAFKARKELHALGQQYDELHKAKEDLEEGYDRDVESLNIRLEARDKVIERLLDRIRRTYEQVRRDNNKCTYSEPLEIMNLLAGVGQQPDDQWFKKLLEQALREEKQKAKDRKAVELARRTGVWPLARLDGAADRRICACGQTWHMDEVPENHNGLECQPEPKKEDPAVECDCGMTWPDGKMGSGHGDMHCQALVCSTQFNGGPCAGIKGHLGDCSPEKCLTQFNGGPCAGIKGHPGDCSPNADDIPVSEEG